MAESAFLFYGILATFVINCMKRNKQQGRDNIKQLVLAGWGLLLVSLAAATYFSLTALSLVIRA